MKKRLVILLCLMLVLLSGCGSDRPRENQEKTLGIDVARYQGTIDWKQVADSGVEFAMVRIGYRRQEDGVIQADSNAAYNLQQAQANGIKLGAYFFSTAVNAQEAREEALWTAEFLAPYPITYPVAYDCEGYNDLSSRQHGLTPKHRTDLALEFLEAVEDAGYEGMFYSSKNELEGNWETERLQEDYKIWVAQYPQQVNPVVQVSSYSGLHQMWQYTDEGTVPGISQNVDRNIAYFGYDGFAAAKSKEVPPKANPDPEALMPFQEVSETVTAKVAVNLRNIPSQGVESMEMYLLQNGEHALRTGISDAGWSRVEFQGQIYYAVSSYLTTDLSYAPPEGTPEYEDDPGDGLETEFVAVRENVTAKEKVNLRNIPSTTRWDSEIVVLLKAGDIAVRTGIDPKWGWSRVEYEGKILYCISSYLEVVEDQG